jgi:hypothetical protein
MENRCSCGLNKNHPKVIHRTEYTKWGWFLFTVLGLSAKPKKVNFVCTKCEEIIESTQESHELARYIGR